MERKETENREPRTGVDSPEQDSAPVTDDATRGDAEGVVGSPWWEGGSGLEEAAEEEPDTPRGTGYIYRGVRYGEPIPETKSQPTEDPGDDDDPVDLSVLAVMSEDQPAIPPAEGEEADEPVADTPWWQARSRPEEAAEEEPGTGYDESFPEPKSQPTEDPGDDADPVVLSVPAAMSTDQPAVPPADREEPRGMDAREEPAVHHPEPDREPPGPPAGLPVATEGLAERPPAELIRAIVAEVCPGELLLVEADVAPLPEWAHTAATAARNDLDRRSGEHTPIDAGEYLRLAIVENAMGLHDEADNHLKEALPRSDRFGPVLNALAVTSLARGKIAPAIVYCREALRETGGDDSVRAAASSNLGDLYDLQGDTARAAEAYETAIKCLQAREDPRWLSRLHLRAGRLYRRMGQADKARLHLSDSVRLFKDSGDLAGHVQSLAALGSALTESGLTDLALRNFEEAVRICLRTGDKPGAALVQDELGIAYTVQDQLTRALAYFESALWLHRELGNRKAEAATLSNMAKIHDSRGDSGEARQLYESALEIDPQVGRAGLPHPASGDQGGARAKLLQAEEILSRAESAEQQEYVQRMIEKPGTGTEGLG